MQFMHNQQNFHGFVSGASCFRVFIEMKGGAICMRGTAAFIESPRARVNRGYFFGLTGRGRGCLNRDVTETLDMQGNAALLTTIVAVDTTNSPLF